MDFSCYVARNRLTGGYMAEHADLRKLKKHVLAKAEPGKNVAIYARTTLGGEREVCRLTVPIPRDDKPTVHTQAKSEKLDKPAKPEPEPFKPIVMDRWTITNLSVLKGYPIDPPKLNPKTGKMMTYAKFTVPIVSVYVRGNHWPEGMQITITRSKGGFSMKFPNDNGKGAKPDGSMGHSLTTVRLTERFGKEACEEIFNLFAMAMKVSD